MKTILYSLLTFFLLYNVVHAQETVTIGGASTTTSRTFVVEQNIRIRDMEDKSNEPAYNQVLFANANGNIDRVPKNSFVPTTNNNENKLYYLNNQPQSASVTIGDFIFYFRPSTTAGKHLDVMLRLVEDPGQNTFIFYSLYRKFNMYNNQWLSTPAPNGTFPTAVSGGSGNGSYYNGLHRNYYKANHKLFYPGSNTGLVGDFTPKNWADGQLLCPGFDIGDFAEVWLSYPGKAVAYRAVFYARQNENTASYNMRKSYTILVEKFENSL